MNRKSSHDPTPRVVIWLGTILEQNASTAAADGAYSLVQAASRAGWCQARVLRRHLDIRLHVSSATQTTLYACYGAAPQLRWSSSPSLTMSRKLSLAKVHNLRTVLTFCYSMPPSGIQWVIWTPAWDRRAIKLSCTVLELEFWSMGGLSAKVREAADVGIPSINTASALITSERVHHVRV